MSPACLPVCRVSRLSPCVSQSLRSDARCCDAGSGVVSPACFSVYAVRCQMLRRRLRACLRLSPCVSQSLPVSPSVVTDVGSKLVSRLSPFVSQSPWSDARCCDAGSRVVYPACLPVSPRCCGLVTLAPGSCLPLVSLVSHILSPGSCLWLVFSCDAGSGLVSLCLPVSAVRC